MMEKGHVWRFINYESECPIKFTPTQRLKQFSCQCFNTQLLLVSHTFEMLHIYQPEIVNRFSSGHWIDFAPLKMFEVSSDWFLDGRISPVALIGPFGTKMTTRKLFRKIMELLTCYQQSAARASFLLTAPVVFRFRSCGI